MKSMNKTTKKQQQLDLHLSHWTTDETGTYVYARYYGSQFLDRSTAEDLLDKFKVSQQSLLSDQNNYTLHYK